MAIDWRQGPIASLMGRGNGTAPRSTGSYVAQGARLGSVAGPVGTAVGALGGWIYSRMQDNAGSGYSPTAAQTQDWQNNAVQNQINGIDIGDMSRNQADSFGQELDAATDWSPDNREVHNPQERRDAAAAGTLPQLRGSFNQFSPGVTLYIGGSSDPNGRYRQHRDPGN